MSRKHSVFKRKIGQIAILLLAILLLYNIKDISRLFLSLPYRQIIFNEASESGLDGYLLAAIAKTESNFNPKAVSVKGAIGLMQIMPDTGKWAADKKGIGDFTPDLLFNPEINIKLAAWYISDLHKEYNGNTVLTLAAYNAGRGNVKKWMEQERWTGQIENIDKIPYPETRQFIRKVLFYKQAYKWLYDNNTRE